MRWRKSSGKASIGGTGNRLMAGGVALFMMH
jgi:hypothetical protein